MNLYNYGCIMVIILIPVGILLLRNRCRKASMRELLTEPQAESKIAVPPPKAISIVPSVSSRVRKDSPARGSTVSFEPFTAKKNQPELFHGKWVNDGSANGLPCQKHRLPYLDRVFLSADRRRDRREGASHFQTFDGNLTEALPNQLVIMPIHLPQAIGLDVNNELPPNARPFREIPDNERKIFDWIARYMLEQNAEEHLRRQLASALNTDIEAVEEYVRANLANLCKSAAKATGVSVSVNFTNTPMRIALHLKKYMATEISSLPK
jgi:hypothetical protein